MKLTLLICLVLLSTVVLSLPVNEDEMKNVDKAESIPETDDEVSRKFKGPIKIKKCAKPDQSIEYYQRWCPTVATTTSTTTVPTTTSTTTTTTTASTTTTTAAAAK